MVNLTTKRIEILKEKAILLISNLKNCLLVSWCLFDSCEGCYIYKFDCVFLGKVKNNAVDSSRIGRGAPMR